MKKILFTVLTLFAFAHFSAKAENLPFDASNPFIWDNDSNEDVFTQELVMSLAHKGMINLVGITQSPHPWRNAAEDFQDVVIKARNSGLTNIPDAVWDLGQYYMTALSRPSSGNIDDTQPLDTAPARTIRDKVLQEGTVLKPVVIGAGGPLTTIASAYLLAKNAGRAAEFAGKVIVSANIGFVAGGSPSISNYNAGQDEWAAYICLTRLKVVVVDVKNWPRIWDFIGTLPSNELTQYMRTKKASWPYPDTLGDGDAQPVLILLLPNQGNYFTSTTRVSSSYWAPWPVSWGDYGLNSLNWDAYKADLKIKADPGSDDIFLTGYNQSVTDQTWMDAFTSAFSSPYCGDSSCNGTETCSSCRSDCGVCPLGNLIVHWKLDDGSGIIAQDSSGNGNTGTLYGATWVIGNDGNALSFNGENASISAGTGYRPTTAITVAFWIYPRELVNGAGLVADLNYNGGAYYGILWDMSSNGATYWRAGEGNSGDAVVNSPAGTLVANQWIHLAITWENNVTRFYKNGIQLTTGGSTNAAQISYAGAPGLDIAGNPQYLNAILDDVRIYNRVLTPSEIQRLTIPLLLQTRPPE